MGGDEKIYAGMFKKVLDYVDEHGYITTRVVKDVCSVGNEKARKVLDHLIAERKLERNSRNRCVFCVGADKTASKEFGAAFADQVHEGATQRDIVRYKLTTETLRRKVRETGER